MKRAVAFLVVLLPPALDDFGVLRDQERWRDSHLLRRGGRGRVGLRADGF